MNLLTPLNAWDFLQKNKDAIVVDVRSPEEWQTGIIDISSTNNEPLYITITANSDDFVDKLQQNIKNPSAPILFLCYGGIRSAAAATIAEKSEYINCYNIAGGFNEWYKSGLPIKKETNHA